MNDKTLIIIAALAGLWFFTRKTGTVGAAPAAGAGAKAPATGAGAGAAPALPTAGMTQAQRVAYFDELGRAQQTDMENRWPYSLPDRQGIRRPVGVQTLAPGDNDRPVSALTDPLAVVSVPMKWY